MNPDTAEALAAEFAALAERLTGVPNPALPPVFTGDITSGGVGVSPTQVEATELMFDALLEAPPGAIGVVRPARLPYCGPDYVYEPPVVEGERTPDGVVLWHPGLPGGLPRRRRPFPLLGKARKGGAS